MQVIAKARGLSSALCLLLVAASSEHTHWTQRHMRDHQTCNLQKFVPWYSSNALDGSLAISSASGNYFTSKLLWTPKIKIEFKGVPVFFLFCPKFLPMNGVRKKRSQIQTSEFPNNNIHIPEKSLSTLLTWRCSFSSKGRLRLQWIGSYIYRTLHSFNLIWAVCHLFPQRWRTLTYSVSGNHWPGEPRDMLKTTSTRKFSSCVWSLLQDTYFL